MGDNPEPIRQRIEADYDDRGLKDAARDTAAVGEATEKAGDRAEQASKQTDKLTKESEQLSSAAKDQAHAQRRATGAVDDYGRSTDKATGKTGLFDKAIGLARGSLAGLVGGIIGGAGLNAAMQAYERHLDAINKRLEKNAQLTRDAADAALELQFLNLVPDPTERAFAEEQAVLAGRNPTEGVRAFGALRSKNANADREQLKQLLQLSALKAQQTTASIEDIAGGLSLINKFTNDPIAASNILEQGITEAGELDVAKFIPLMAKFLPKGVNIADLSAGESVGYVAGITGLGLPGEEAVTSLGNIALAIKGKGTPEGAKILEREQIDRSDFGEALRQISAAYAEGRIKPEELQLIGGDSALTGLASLADPKILADLQAGVGRVDAAGASDTLLVSEKAKAHFTPGSVAALNLQLNQAESALLQQQQNDTNAIQIKAARALVEQQLDQAVAAGNMSPAMADQKLATYDKAIRMGFGPSWAAQFAENAVVSPTIDGFTNAVGLSVAGPIPVIRSSFKSLAGTPDLSQAVDDQMSAGPDITADGPASVTNNYYGPVMNNRSDPATSGLDQRRPPN